MAAWRAMFLAEHYGLEPYPEAPVRGGDVVMAETPITITAADLERLVERACTAAQRPSAEA